MKTSSPNSRQTNPDSTSLFIGTIFDFGTRRSILIFLLALHFVPSFASDLFWVSPGSGNWHDAANWSAVSGGAGGAGIPGSTDRAIFDASRNTICIIDADADVNGILIKAGHTAALNLYNGPNLYIGTQGYKQYNGSFDGEYGYMEVRGNVLLAGGNFLCPQSSLAITGTRTSNDTLFKCTNGQFDDMGADVFISPSSGCSTFSFYIDVPSSASFYNVMLSAGNSCSSAVPSVINVVAGDTMNVLHKLTLDSGRVGGGIKLSGDLFILDAQGGDNGNVMMCGNGIQHYSAAHGSRMCGLVIDKPSGTVTAVSSTHILSVSAFQMRNGTFFAPVDTFYVGGAHYSSSTVFAQTGGIFDNNNAVVCFDPYANAQGCTFQLTTGNMTPFKSVLVNNAQQPFPSQLVLQAGDSLFCSSDLGLIAGKCNGGKFVTEANVYIGSAWTGGNTALVLSGKDPQSIDAAQNPAGFDGDITIQKLQDAVTLVSPLILDQSGQALHLVHGNLNTSSSELLTFSNGTFAADANDSSFVCGPVVKAGNDAFEFPIGKCGYSYAPIRIDATTDVMNVFRAEYFPSAVPANYPTWSMTPSLSNVYAGEYWDFQHLAGNTAVNISLSWNADRSDPAVSSTQAVVAQWNGSAWTSYGNQAAQGNFITGATAITVSQPLTFGAGTPLGVEMSSSIKCSVYPNPAHEQLNIIGTVPGTSFDLINVSGNVLVNGTVTGNVTTVDVRDLPAGNYFVRLVRNDEVITKKVTLY